MLLTAFIFTCTSAAFGLMLGVLCRTPDQLSAAATTLCLALAALGGTWWPLDVAPLPLQAVGRALPTGQAMQALQSLILHGPDGLPGARAAWLGLACWGALFLAVGAALFRFSLRSKPKKPAARESATLRYHSGERARFAPCTGAAPVSH